MQAKFCAGLLLAASCYPQTVALHKYDGTTGNFTITGHPRGFYDGPSGSVTAWLKDPDGNGPQNAPGASGPAWDTMIARVNGYVADIPASLSPWPELAMFAAMGWYADNTRTQYLELAKYHVNNFERQFPKGMVCDESVNYCGVGSDNDWNSIHVAGWAQVYSIIESQLNAAEKTAFKRKVLNDIEDGCVNQLQLVNGTVSSTGTTATPSDPSILSLLSVGMEVYFRASSGSSTGQWRTVTAIGGSSFTINSSLSVSNQHLWRKAPWTEGMCGVIWSVSHHLYSHRLFNTYAETTLAAAVTSASQTSIQVASAAGFPAEGQEPYYVKITSEWVRVTARSGATLTVQRGQLYSAAASSYPVGRSLFYQRYPPGVATSEITHNISQQKIWSAIIVGLVLADDPRGAALLQKGVQLFATGFGLDHGMWKYHKQFWTGLTQSGQYYVGGRPLEYNPILIHLLKTNLTPGMDGSGGNWIKDASTYYWYFAVPDHQYWMRHVKWGDPGVTLDVLEDDDHKLHFLMPTLYPGSDEAKYSSFWVRQLSQLSTRITGSGGRENIPYLLAFTRPSDPEQDFRQVLPTQHFFTRTDEQAVTPNLGLHAMVSRSNWNTDATHLTFFSYDVDVRIDHQGRGCPGTYHLYKKGALIEDNAFGSSGNNYSKGANEYTYNNMVEFGGHANFSSGLRDASIDRQKAGSNNEFAYARGNYSGFFNTAAGVTRSFRHMLHFKKAGAEDFVVVYDDAGLNAPNSIRTFINYSNNGNSLTSPSSFTEGQTVLNAAADEVTSTGSTLAHSVRSKVLLPQTPAVITDLVVVASTSTKTLTVGPYCSTSFPCRAKLNGVTYTYTQPGVFTHSGAVSGTTTVRIYIDVDGSLKAAKGGITGVSCSGSLTCDTGTAFPPGAIELAENNITTSNVAGAPNGSSSTTRMRHYSFGMTRMVTINAGQAVTDAEFLVVHKPSDSISDTLPAISLLTVISSGFRGVLVGGSSPKVGVFPRSGGSANQVAFTASGFGGTAQILVAGLDPGDYEVKKNGLTVIASAAVDGSGALYMEDTEGAFSLTRVGTPPAAQLQITPTTMSFQFETGGDAPPAQGLLVDAVNGPVSFSVSVSPSWLHLDSSGGSTPQTLQVSVDPAGLEAAVYEGSVVIEAPTATNSPQTIPVTFTITAPGSLSATPPSLSFEYAIGGDPPWQREVSVESNPVGLSYTASSTAPWISVIDGGGTTPGLVRINVNAQGLEPGTYDDVVRLTPEQQGVVPLTVGVQLIVVDHMAQILGVASSQALIRYRPAGTGACVVRVAKAEDGSENSANDAGGLNSRTFVASVEPLHHFRFRADCGNQIIVNHFATPEPKTPEARNLDVRLAPPPGRSIATARIDYGESPALGNQLEQACPSTCQLSVPVQTDRVVYLRTSYRNGSGQVVAEGSMRPLLIP